jgi:hypothetical protein
MPTIEAVRYERATLATSFPAGGSDGGERMSGRNPRRGWTREEACVARGRPHTQVRAPWGKSARRIAGSLPVGRQVGPADGGHFRPQIVRCCRDLFRFAADTL